MLAAVATLLEIAKAAGYSTGIVVTSRMTHATPACFTSHASNRSRRHLARHLCARFRDCFGHERILSGCRGDEYFIAWQQVTQVRVCRRRCCCCCCSPHQVNLPDVMMGGGRSIFTEASVDGRTLLQLAQDRGSSYISSSSQLARVLADPSAYSSKPLLGLFSPNHMPCVTSVSQCFFVTPCAGTSSIRAMPPRWQTW
jgi:alkaline phosphatase